MLNCILSVWENNTETLVISKRLKFPYDDRMGTNFRMRFQRDLKVLWIA